MSDAIGLRFSSQSMSSWVIYVRGGALGSGLNVIGSSYLGSSCLSGGWQQASTPIVKFTVLVAGYEVDIFNELLFYQ